MQAVCIPTASGPSSLDSVKHIHPILQHICSLPKCQLSEERCVPSELSVVDSPAQLRPSCSAMSTIFWSALSLLLRDPGGEDGVKLQLHRTLHRGEKGNRRLVAL